MATHSSVLAWRIPGTVEPAGLTQLSSNTSDSAQEGVCRYRRRKGRYKANYQQIPLDPNLDYIPSQLSSPRPPG